MMELTGENLRLENIAQVARGDAKVSISAQALERIKKSRDYIDRRLSAGEVMYGVNTGFGAFSSVRISDAEIEDLQRNLIRSHSVGVGEPLTREQTRAIMLLRANALVRGHSGVRPIVVEKLLQFLNHDILPVIPSQGSVGASGDLAPLSHLALALIGEGMAWGPENSRPRPVGEVLKEKGLEPLVLKAKEGLSLINGCQVMTAIGSLAVHRARKLLVQFDIAGALSLEALRGSRKAFDPLISDSRPHRGERISAANLRRILGANSAIGLSHENCTKVQDAYSLRCMPAVHGAGKDALRYVEQVLETEANSSTDNPLVFAEQDKVLSCGNFHGEPVAYAMDFAAIALSGAANISECRIEKLINPSMSDLPAFLAPKGGLHSGHMIVQVAAASLVSENKVLSHPASVDSIPTSADKEDHVSMGTIAARKFNSILRNCEYVLTMEFLSASQGLEFHRPLQSSPALEAAHSCIRRVVPFAKEDRIFSTDIEAIRELVVSGQLLQEVEKEIGSLDY
jgi:histidine ammonia-lyase